MARLTTTGKTIGSIGPVVFRNYNGKTILQSRPGKFKQTTATVASGKEFGTASRLSKAIRQALHSIVLGFNDNRMYIRFTSVLYQTIISNKLIPKGVRTLADGDLSLINHFQCNIESPFSDYCTIIPELHIDDSRIVTVALSEFKIADAFFAPENASQIALCFLVSCIGSDTGSEMQSESFKLDISLRDPNAVVLPQQWQTAALPQNCIVFVSVAIIFYQTAKLFDKVNLNNKMLHPCEIVTAFRI